LTRGAEAISRRRDHATHFGHVAFYAAQSHELCVRHLRNDVRERGFSGARRTGKNYGRQTIGFNRSAQKFSRPENMFLADEFLEGMRPHPRRERRGSIGGRKIDIFDFREQILHPEKYGGSEFFASDFELSAARGTS